MTLDERVADLNARLAEDGLSPLGAKAEADLRRVVDALRIEPTAITARPDGWPAIYVDRDDDRLCLHVMPDSSVKLWTILATERE